LISPRYPLVELGVGLAFAAIYYAEFALVCGGRWEEIRAVVMLIHLLLLWSAISVVVVLALSLCDARAELARLTHRPGVHGQNQNLSRCEHTRVGKPILVQFDDLIDTMGISQPVAGDTPESLVGPDDVDRRVPSAGVARSARC